MREIAAEGHKNPTSLSISKKKKNIHEQWWQVDDNSLERHLGCQINFQEIQKMKQQGTKHIQAQRFPMPTSSVPSVTHRNRCVKSPASDRTTRSGLVSALPKLRGWQRTVTNDVMWFECLLHWMDPYSGFYRYGRHLEIWPERRTLRGFDFLRAARRR